MGAFFLSLLGSILLVAAPSVDAFVASLAYGTDKIKIPALSILVISGVCTGILGVSLAAGKLIQPLLPPHLIGGICFSILCVLGVIKLFDSAVKSFIRRHQSGQKRLSFQLFDLRFILQIYVDSTAADQDRSRSLSPAEASSLAFALSIDGLAAGLGAGLTEGSPVPTIIVSLLVTALAVAVGGLVGRKLAEKLSFDLSWLSGALLIILAFLKL